MPKLSPVSRRALIEKLRKLGFSGPYPATRHEYMERGSEKIFIPNPHGKDIGVPLVKAIMAQLGISRDEFMKL
jgi:hypothetical protein